MKKKNIKEKTFICEDCYNLGEIVYTDGHAYQKCLVFIHSIEVLKFNELTFVKKCNRFKKNPLRRKKI